MGEAATRGTNKTVQDETFQPTEDIYHNIVGSGAVPWDTIARRSRESKKTNQMRTSTSYKRTTTLLVDEF